MGESLNLHSLSSQGVGGSIGASLRHRRSFFHRSHCFRTASRYFRSRGHLGGQPPGRFRAQLGDGTVGVITSATVPPKNRRSASKRNMPPFLFAQPVFRWPPEPSKWCPEGASSSAAEPVGRPVQLVARGSVLRHEQQNGRQPVPKTPPRQPRQPWHPPPTAEHQRPAAGAAGSGRQPVPPWRSSPAAEAAEAAVAPAAEAAEAAVAARGTRRRARSQGEAASAEAAEAAPEPAAKARPLRPRPPSGPPPLKALREAEAEELLELHSAWESARPQRGEAFARSSANKLSGGRTHRPSTEGSCGLELVLRRLMNTLLTKSKRERCRETI